MFLSLFFFFFVLCLLTVNCVSLWTDPLHTQQFEKSKAMSNEHNRSDLVHELEPEKAEPEKAKQKEELEQAAHVLHEAQKQLEEAEHEYAKAKQEAQGPEPQTQK